MCRLMGYVAQNKIHFSDLAGPSLDQFLQLSTVHCDGWGISTVDSKTATATLDKAAATAYKSAQFDSVIAASESDGALLHLRWATKGLAVSEDNAHPFNLNGFSFIHNGAIYPANGVDHEINNKYLLLKKGDTDSESFFFLLLTKIDIYGVIEGVKKAITILKEKTDYSSINAMLINKEKLVVICEHDPMRKPKFGDPDYYTLKYRCTPDGVIVASSGWEQTGWEILPNHHIMVVDRQSFEIQVIAI